MARKSPKQASAQRFTRADTLNVIGRYGSYSTVPAKFAQQVESLKKKPKPKKKWNPFAAIADALGKLKK